VPRRGPPPPVAEAELAQDGAEPLLDGFFGDEECPRDLGVPTAGPDEGDDFQLASGQRRVR